MKVLGIGAPRTLELRLKCCELGIWREVLREAHAEELQRGAARREPDLRMRELSRLLAEAHAPWRLDQPVIVVGATSMLGPLMRAAAAAAVEKYVAVTTALVSETADVSPDNVRAALDTVGAWTATLLALQRVEHADAAL